MRPPARVCTDVSALRWLVATLLVACSSSTASELPPPPTPKPRAAPVKAAAVHHGKLDPGRPFELWFGRRTGGRALEIIYIPEVGEIEIDRDKADDTGAIVPQRGTVALDERQWDDLRDLVRHIKIDQLQHSYVAEDHTDGTEWILRAHQAAYDRTIHCHNRFPPELIRFAESLDKLLLTANLADNAFEPAPPDADQRELALLAGINP